MSTCLIVAFYAGNRDGGQEKLFNEYLHTQIEALSKYKHSLSKIIFVIAQDNISESYSTENDGITYLYRKNGWLSFGSWMEAIRIYSNYDYYILCEDDYIFMKDNYDTVLVSELEKQGVEYLVTWKNDSLYKGKFRGGLISTIGILSKRVLERLHYFRDISLRTTKHGAMADFLSIFNSIGCLPYEHNLFPYYCYITNSICYYSNDTTRPVDDNRKRVICGCYQYYQLLKYS